MPDGYRSDQCQDGGDLDLDPGSRRLAVTPAVAGRPRPGGVDSARASWRRTAEPRSPPRREGPAGRLRRLRRLGPRRGGRQAHLLRPLRAAAPRPGVGRHRGQRRLARSSSTRTWAWSPRSSTSATCTSLRGHLAIGHCRYSTTGVQRVGERPADLPRHRDRRRIALGHNGNLTNTGELAAAVEELRPERGELPLHGTPAMRSTSDTDLLTALLASHPDLSLEAAALEVLPPLRGRLLAGLHGRDHAVRRARPAGRPAAGARPARARLGGRHRDRGARHRRRVVRPRGRARRADRDRRARPADRSASPRPTPKGCLFEYVYLARPDTTISGRSMHATRVEIGRRLAARGAGRGRPGDPGARVRHPGRDRLRQESGIPFGQGLVKNSYVGRTFIQPSQTIRQLGIRLKLNPLREVIAGQAAGRRRRLDRARQHPARAGPDAARGRRGRGARADLLAAGEVAVLLRHRLRHAGRADRERAAVEEIRASIGADSLAYISLEELVAATTRRRRPAVPGLLRRRVPDRAARAGAARQAPARGPGARGRAPTRDGLPDARRRWRRGRTRCDRP